MLDTRTYDDAMSTTAARPVPPAPTCAPAQVGPCAGCGHPTKKYGEKSCPLCVVCLTAVEAARTR